MSDKTFKFVLGTLALLFLGACVAAPKNPPLPATPLPGNLLGAQDRYSPYSLP